MSIRRISDLESIKKHNNLDILNPSNKSDRLNPIEIQDINNNLTTFNFNDSLFEISERCDTTENSNNDTLFRSRQITYLDLYKDVTYNIFNQNSIFNGNKTFDAAKLSVKMSDTINLDCNNAKIQMSSDIISASGQKFDVLVNDSINLSSSNVILSGNNNVGIYSSNIGISGTTTNISGATTLNLSGTTTNISGTTTNIGGTTTNIEATNINLSGTTNISGTTNFYNSFNIKYTKNNREANALSFNNGIATFAEPISGIAMSAYWADLAECYAADAEYIPGTLMQFGGKNEVTIATTEANAVVSERPALLMNSELFAEHKVKLALVGRVRVRVKGSINKFDRIILSDVPGVACRRKFENQKSIGIALEESENKDEKLILCAVKLEL